MIVPFTIPIEGKKCVVTQYDNVALVFAEEINDELCRFVDISTKEEVSVIILSLRRDFPASFQSSVTCLYLRDEDFSDSIIKEKYCIRFVFGVGVNGQATAHNFSVKNKGVTRITNSEAYKRMIRGIGKSILLKTYDGLGDLIMLTPSAKAWYNKGYSVDILTIPERQGVVDGLHYIRKVYYDEKEVTYGSYKKIYDISGKISEYSQSYCRQHRVFTIANLVGLSNDEVSKDMLPDLPARDINILSTKASNMEWAKQLIAGVRNPVALTLTSIHTSQRSLPPNKQQELVDRLVKEGFTPILLHSRKVELSNCTNLTGEIDREKFFGIMYHCPHCITIDTSAVHIRAAYRKPIILLAGYIRPEWRTYEGVETHIIKPELDCYPCNECAQAECFTSMKCYPKCISDIEIDKIVEILLNYSKK